MNHIDNVLSNPNTHKGIMKMFRSMDAILSSGDRESLIKNHPQKHVIVLKLFDYHSCCQVMLKKKIIEPDILIHHLDLDENFLSRFENINSVSYAYSYFFYSADDKMIRHVMKDKEPRTVNYFLQADTEPRILSRIVNFINQKHVNEIIKKFAGYYEPPDAEILFFESAINAGFVMKLSKAAQTTIIVDYVDKNKYFNNLFSFDTIVVHLILHLTRVDKLSRLQKFMKLVQHDKIYVVCSDKCYHDYVRNKLNDVTVVFIDIGDPVVRSRRPIATIYYNPHLTEMLFR